MFIKIFNNLYLRSSFCVGTGNGDINFFEITTIVTLGYIRSPLLFMTVLDYIMRRASTHIGSGIHFSDHDQLSDLDFADYNALLEEDELNLQQGMTNLGGEASKIGQRIIPEN